MSFTADQGCTFEGKSVYFQKHISLSCHRLVISTCVCVCFSLPSVCLFMSFLLFCPLRALIHNSKL